MRASSNRATRGFPANAYNFARANSDWLEWRKTDACGFNLQGIREPGKLTVGRAPRYLQTHVTSKTTFMAGMPRGGARGLVFAHLRMARRGVPTIAAVCFSA